MKRMLIFWEMHDSSMSFMPILPKTSHHTIHKVYVQEHNSPYPILWVTTRYSYSKRCDTFWNRNIVLLPIVLDKVSCVPNTTLCELYGVKFWEGLA